MSLSCVAVVVFYPLRRLYIRRRCIAVHARTFQCNVNAFEMTEAEAASLAEQGRFTEAINLYRLASHQQPKNASLLEQLSQCLLETDQYQEAYAAALQAYTLVPAVRLDAVRF